MPLIVGNPESRRIMQTAYVAYQKHGLSVQGTLPEFRACECNRIVRAVFWRDALTDWCHIEPRLAANLVADLEAAT